MGERKSIVAGGGCYTAYVYGRHNARMFGQASGVWCVVTLMACNMLREGIDPGLWWVPWSMMAPHPVLIALAIYLWRTEKPSVRKENVRGGLV